MVMPKIHPVTFVPNFYTNNKVEAIPDYDGQTQLNQNRSGNFKLDAGSEGVNDEECKDNIIPLNVPNIGAQDSSEFHMYFGVNYNFTRPNTYEECN